MNQAYCLAESPKCKNREICMRYLPNPLKEDKRSFKISIMDASHLIPEDGQCDMQMIHES